MRTWTLWEVPTKTVREGKISEMAPMVSRLASDLSIIPVCLSFSHLCSHFIVFPHRSEFALLGDSAIVLYCGTGCLARPATSQQVTRIEMLALPNGCVLAWKDVSLSFAAVITVTRAPMHSPLGLSCTHRLHYIECIMHFAACGVESIRRCGY